jgi:hypothetical protein
VLATGPLEENLSDRRRRYPIGEAAHTGAEPDRGPARGQADLAVSSLVWMSVARAKYRDPAGGDAYILVAGLPPPPRPDHRRALFRDCVVSCVAIHDLLEGGSAGLTCAAPAIRDAIRAQAGYPVHTMEA